VVEIPEREVTIHRFERVGEDTFAIECSSGTYVRSLIADLRDAYCDELERTATGAFRLEDAVAGPLPADLGAALVPLARALEFLPARGLGDEEARAVRHGRRVAATDAREGHIRLMAGDELVAIGERRGDALQPVVVFSPA
jgi:tRNA pseudouridine55 synthase